MPNHETPEKTAIILEAARIVLAREGYAAATISQIAAEAGVSRGLLHYYFKSKEELLIRVFRHNMEKILEATSRIFENAPDASALASGLSEALRFILEWDPHFFTLFMEGWTLTRQGPQAMALLREYHERFRRTIREGLDGMAERGAVSPDKDLGGVAAVLTALVDGLGMQMVVEPELSGDEAVWQATRSAIQLMAEFAK